MTHADGGAMRSPYEFKIEWAEINQTHTTLASGPGFVVTASSKGIVAIRLESWAPFAGDALRSHHVTHVHLAENWQGPEAGIDFLAPYADQIDDINISCQVITDLSALSAFPKLKGLSLDCPAETVPFHALPSLVECGLDRSATMGSVEQAPSLEYLALVGLRVHDLSQLSDAAALRRLRLTQLKHLDSLNGIAGTRITALHIQQVSRICSIAPLVNLPLRQLMLMGCAKVTDVEQLETLTQMEELSIISGAELRNLGFLKPLTKLRSLHFGNTGTEKGGSCSVSSLAGLRELRALRLLGGSRSMESLTDIEMLGALTNLEVLYLARGPKAIASLAFVSAMSNLRELGIEGTTIRDGDLRVLVEHPVLRSVQLYPMHRKYTHSEAQLANVFAARTR